MRRKLKASDFIVLILDILITVFAFFVAYSIRRSLDSIEKPFYEFWQYAWILWFFIPTQYLSFAYFGLYGSKKTNAPLSIFVTMVKSFGMTSLISAAAVFFTHSDTFSRLLFTLFIIIDFSLLIIEKLIVRAYLCSLISKNRAQKQIVIVGDPDNSEKIIKNLPNGRSRN